MTWKKKRLYEDGNGFYEVQVQFPNWDPREWGSVYITRIYEHALRKLEEEPGELVEMNGGVRA